MAVSVEDLEVDLEDGVRVGATVFRPAGGAPHDDPEPVLFLLPGAGAGRGYFDLAPDGEAGWSQGRWHAERGLLTVALDHVGTDGSMRVPAGGLSREWVTAMDDAAVRGVLADLCAERGELVPIGAGHSLGGHVVAGLQAEHQTFRGIGVLGASMTWTRLVPRAGDHHPHRAATPDAWITAAAGADFVATAYWEDVREWAVEVERRATVDGRAPWQAHEIPPFAVDLLRPYESAREAASVRVPVLVVCGERDVTVDPLDDAATFRSAPAVSMLVVPRMGHSHNFASTRAIGWQRLHSFVEEVVALEAAGLSYSV